MRPVVTVLALLGLATWSLAADVHLLVSIPQIEGSSEVAGYQNWIECAGLTHNIPGLPKSQELLRPIPHAQQGHLDIAHNFPGVELILPSDKASPKLLLACERGTPLGPVRLILMSLVGDQQLIHFSCQLENPVIESYIIRGPGFGDRSTLLHPISNDKPMVCLRLMPKSLDWERGAIIRPER